MNNKGTDQTAPMCRLICAFVVRILHKQAFSWCGSYKGFFFTNHETFLIKFYVNSLFWLDIFLINQSIGCIHNINFKLVFAVVSDVCMSEQDWHVLAPIIAQVVVYPNLKQLSHFMPYANNKDADQPAHLRSLISAFVVHYLDRIIPVLAKSKISRP